MLAILTQAPLVTVFLILALGTLLGRAQVGGIKLGGVTGVLLVGLVVGHLDLPVPTTTYNLGFLLFMYGIGFEAGPRFLQAFRKDGIRHFILACVVALSGGFLTYGVARYFDFDLGSASGLLGGALTSTPTIVAAQDVVSQGLTLPPGMSQGEVIGNISSAYAITYVFGIVGLILFISFFPRLVGIDLPEEARALGEREATRDTERYLRQAPGSMVVRAYRVENRAVTGIPLAERDHGEAWEIQRIKRGSDVFVPDEDAVLEQGDILAIVATRELHRLAPERIGPEVVDHEVMDRSVESRRIVLAKRALQGKTLAEMNFSGHHECWLTEVSRGGHSLPRRPDIKLQLGDVLTLTGSRSRLDAVAELMGEVEGQRWATDLLSFSLGIALGLALGLIKVPVAGVEVGLGSAGGVLASGILFGTLNSYRPNVASFPEAARSILTELGLLLFMTGVGVSAGGSIVATFRESGPGLILAGAVVTILPVVLAFVVGRYLMRMNAALLFGAIAGSMTSTPALLQVQAQARSVAPAMGYVGSYTFANVLLSLTGALLMRF